MVVGELNFSGTCEHEQTIVDDGDEKQMRFDQKIVVVTGGAHGIGRAVKEAFEKEGAIVECIDIKPGDHYVGDISKKEVLEEFAAFVLAKHGHVNSRSEESEHPWT